MLDVIMLRPQDSSYPKKQKTGGKIKGSMHRPSTLEMFLTESVNTKKSMDGQDNRVDDASDSEDLQD